MWVFCCGMFRSGSTLHYQLARSIVEHAGVGKGAGITDANSFAALMETTDANHQLIVVKSHEFIPQAAELSQQGQAKTIYIYRDIRDVVVSWMNMQGWSFEQVIERDFIRLDCIERGRAWTSLSNVLITRYEDLRETDLVNEVLRIAYYLGVTLELDAAIQIASDHSLERQQQYIQGFDFAGEGISVGYTRYDPSSLLHNRHILSSQSGQWQNVLSPAQIEAVEAIGGDWLRETGYKTAAVDNRLTNARVDQMVLWSKLQTERECRKQLNLIEQSWGWRFILKVNGLRKRLLPEGSFLERIYLRLKQMVMK